MKKKALLGRKENDPEWIKEIASCVKSGETDKYNRQLRELFLDSTRDGLAPKEAWEKARRVLASFEINK